MRFGPSLAGIRVDLDHLRGLGLEPQEFPEDGLGLVWFLRLALPSGRQVLLRWAHQGLLEPTWEVQARYDRQVVDLAVEEVLAELLPALGLSRSCVAWTMPPEAVERWRPTHRPGEPPRPAFLG